MLNRLTSHYQCTQSHHINIHLAHALRVLTCMYCTVCTLKHAHHTHTHSLSDVLTNSHTSHCTFHSHTQLHLTPTTLCTPSHPHRSTPCPNVKLNDEWGDPIHCEQGDSCPYCHTRTEQQFHPEIYKSTTCNDVQQTGYCPRGPFCAFAHDESESITTITLLIKLYLVEINLCGLA